MPWRDPPHDPNTKDAWDGKMGIFPMSCVVNQKRSAHVQKKGEPKWENENVNAAVHLELMMETVIQISERKWPKGQWNNSPLEARLQQDGAKPHTSGVFLENWQCTMEGLVHEGIPPHKDKIVLNTQPVQSPDLSVNDLGLFAVLQALHEWTVSKGALELVKNVKKVHQECPSLKISHLFLRLQVVMSKVIEHQCGNECKIPHLGKQKLEREGCLPLCLGASPLAAGLMDTQVIDCETQHRQIVQGDFRQRLAFCDT